MGEAIFLRLLSRENKSSALTEAINAMSEGNTLNSTVYIANSTSFAQIPGSTFAYWVSEHIRHLFISLSPFEGDGRTVKQGLATADDFRFVRLWWEVKPENTVFSTTETKPEQILEQTFLGKRWIPFAKGGAYSPYYADLHLVVNWERDGEEIRNFKDPHTRKSLSYARNTGFYFRPGLTWPIKNRFTFKPRPLNAGCIFAHVGPAAFISNTSNLLCYQGLLSSSIYTALLRLTAGWNFEVGTVQRTPVPKLSESNRVKLGNLVLTSIDIKRSLERCNEISHIYYLPALLLISEGTLNERISIWQRRLLIAAQQLNRYQLEIDDIAFHSYDIKGQDRQAIEELLKSGVQAAVIIEAKDEENGDEVGADAYSLIADLFSYALGCIFGHWDIHLATGEHPILELPDPFAPLPVRSPAMLTGDDGLPLQETSPDYPLHIKWDGILVDDSDHPDDVIHCLRNVLAVVWKENADAIEQDGCQILGLKELRDHFRRPSNGSFWADHIQRYSKSRRKAPIYWLLQSSKKNYAVWLYYHRLTKDTLFKVLNNYVEPKIRREAAQLKQIRTYLAATGTAGREAKKPERQLERQENFLSELEDFRDKLHRVADLNLEPDLNDGVVLNIAPLWELVPWSEAKKYWEELLAGKYEWSSVSKQLREKGLV